MKAKTIVLLCAALAAGVIAAVLVASTGAPRGGKSEDADAYCYETRQASVCASTRTECETRVAREDPTDVQKRCTPHNDVPLTP